MNLLENRAVVHIDELNKEETKYIQRLLQKQGYHHVAVDGIVGNITRTALNDFKHDNWLGEPNLIGQTTLNLLEKQKIIKTINKEGLELIKHFEGLRLQAYKCPAGIPTIGYGSTFYPDGTKVKMGDSITTVQAENLLKNTLKIFERGVDDAVTVSLTDNQFSALVSFTFNVGLNAFRNSTLLRMLNLKNYNGAADQLLRWNKAGNQTLAGLTRRRQAERNLFLKRTT